VSTKPQIISIHDAQKPTSAKSRLRNDYYHRKIVGKSTIPGTLHTCHRSRLVTLEERTYPILSPGILHNLVYFDPKKDLIYLTPSKITKYNALQKQSFARVKESPTFTNQQTLVSKFLTSLEGFGIRSIALDPDHLANLRLDFPKFCSMTTLEEIVIVQDEDLPLIMHDAEYVGPELQNYLANAKHEWNKWKAGGRNCFRRKYWKTWNKIDGRGIPSWKPPRVTVTSLEEFRARFL